MIVLKSRRHEASHPSRDINSKKVKESCIVAVLIIMSFAATNFPHSFAKVATYKEQQNPGGGGANYQLQFYLILLTYCSLFFHPWFTLHCFGVLRRDAQGRGLRAVLQDVEAKAQTQAGSE